MNLRTKRPSLQTVVTINLVTNRTVTTPRTVTSVYRPVMSIHETVTTYVVTASVLCVESLTVAHGNILLKNV